MAITHIYFTEWVYFDISLINSIPENIIILLGEVNAKDLEKLLKLRSNIIACRTN